MSELTQSQRYGGSAFQLESHQWRSPSLFGVALLRRRFIASRAIVLNRRFTKMWQEMTHRTTDLLIAIFIRGAVPTSGANASIYLETLQVDADSIDSSFLRQLIEHNIDVRKAEDGSFTASLQEYYGERSSIDVDLGTVIVELADRWCFVNRDLQRRARIIGLSYLVWHPEDRKVTVNIHDYKDVAIESYVLRVN